MDAYEILVLVLGIALGVSIIIWIICGMLIVQILRKVKQASETAQHAVDNVESFTAQLKTAGKVSAAGTIINQVMKTFKGRK